MQLNVSLLTFDAVTIRLWYWMGRVEVKVLNGVFIHWMHFWFHYRKHFARSFHSDHRITKPRSIGFIPVGELAVESIDPAPNLDCWFKILTLRCDDYKTEMKTSLVRRDRTVVIISFLTSVFTSPNSPRKQIKDYKIKSNDRKVFGALIWCEMTAAVASEPSILFLFTAWHGRLQISCIDLVGDCWSQFFFSNANPRKRFTDSFTATHFQHRKRFFLRRYWFRIPNGKLED